MYASTHHAWNSVNVRPKRDIVHSLVAFIPTRDGDGAREFYTCAVALQFA